MVTDFQKKLRELREAKDREVQARRAEDDAAKTDRIAVLEHRFDQREKIVRVVEDHADNFTAELDAFARSKSFFEGMYQIVVSGDELLLDDSGAVLKSFSRIAFLLDPRPAPDDETGDSIHVRCKKTVRNRDLESSTHVVGDSESEHVAFQQFVEDEFFAFAGAYLSDSRQAPTPPLR